MDITQLVLDDHHEQRRLFAIVEQVGPTNRDQLAVVWNRLSVFLDLHAEAEDELFYPALLQLGQGLGGALTPTEETQDAIHDHNEIRDAVSNVSRYPTGSDGWYEAVAAANVANGNHMAEEERQGLTDFRRHVSLQTRHDLGVSFAAFEAAHRGGVPAVDKDPQQYLEQYGVHAAPDQARTGESTSLGIGSLKQRPTVW